jgi:ATP-binding protein involved in chromosome partitioning
MTSIQQAVRQSLSELIPDDLQVDLVSAGCLTELAETSDTLRLGITLGYPCASALEALRERIGQAVAPHLAGRALDLDLRVSIKPHRTQNDMPALDQVANVIAVASGKGGVGKSTTAVNLALALSAEGARVGLLDADIFGPSQPLMLGQADGTRPEVLEGDRFVPVPAHGLQTMSMGYLMTRQTPVVWRGPKASGALTQMMLQTLWRDLDYLLIDLPPGTSDIQLTLAQKIPVAGAVVVTTPQDIALLDARKALKMFEKVEVPVLGVVENMATHVCSNCGQEEHIFGEGGGERMAAQYGVAYLGSLPLDIRIREQADGGNPSVVAMPDSDIAARYREIARNAAGRLSRQPRNKSLGLGKIVVQGVPAG